MSPSGRSDLEQVPHPLGRKPDSGLVQVVRNAELATPLVNQRAPAGSRQSPARRTADVWRWRRVWRARSLGQVSVGQL